MKILIYSHFFAPSIGGVESIVMSLAKGLTEWGATRDVSRPNVVTLVTETPAGAFDDRSLSFPVIRRPSLFQLLRLISGSDVVHAAGPSLLLLVVSFLFRKPTIIEHHGYQAICPNGLLIQQPARSICPGHFQAKRYWMCLQCQASEMSWFKAFVRMFLMFPREFLCRSAATNIGITQHVVERIKLPKSRRIYYGIDQLGSESVCCTTKFAYVGRFASEKGVPTLLQAAAILRKDNLHFELLLIGDGPQRSELEDLIVAFNLQDCVRITGFLTGPALTYALRDVGVVIMPSTWEETAGLSAIEQMMRGRLVIASKIGGLGEVVDDAGLTYASANSDQLANCMRRVLHGPSLIDEYGRKARSRALDLFLRSRMISAHVDLYQEVAHRNESRSN